MAFMLNYMKLLAVQKQGENTGRMNDIHRNSLFLKNNKKVMKRLDLL